MMNKKISRVLAAVIALITMTSYTVMATTSSPSLWAAEEINKAEVKGLLTDSVTADYQAYITREQFCELVVKGYEKISKKTAQEGNFYFSDTDNEAVSKAFNLGIVTGYGNNLFGPNDLITREQMAVMIVRMIEKALLYRVDVKSIDYYTFEDIDSISDWALSPMQFVYEKNIMLGIGNNCIAPKSYTTCEQAILLILRTVNRYDTDSFFLENGIAELSPLQMEVLQEYAKRLSECNELDILTSEYAKDFIFCFFTGKGDCLDGYGYWSEDVVRKEYELVFGKAMPDVTFDEEDGTKYENDSYKVLASDFGALTYHYAYVENNGDHYSVIFYGVIPDEFIGMKTINIIPAKNIFGFTVKEVKWQTIYE